MRILILSFYYSPDLCAGSFRATALVEELSSRLRPDDELQVITTQPNRYHSFSVKTQEVEEQGGLKIQRIALPPHKSGMVDQSRAFGFFAREVWRKTTGRNYDLVFATSSRMMTAVLGSEVARRSGALLYLDIRDIFPDTLADVFAGKPQRVVLPFLRALERRTVRRADRINLVSGGFVEYFRQIRADLDYRLFTNGIDDVFMEADFTGSQDGKQRKQILYAGNIGEGQGLHRVIPDAAKTSGDGYEFLVVGDGGARPQLARELVLRGVDNVRIMAPVSRDRLIELYAEADILFLHLNDYPAFHKVLPSKIFEYAATGKPILAGVRGYSQRFIQEQVANAALFDPCDSQGLVAALGRLEHKTTPRDDFVKKFSRRSIIRHLADDILELAAKKR